MELNYKRGSMRDIFRIIKKILCVIGIIVLLLLIHMISILVKDSDNGENVDSAQETTVEFSGQVPFSNIDEDEIPDEKYYSTVEEALKYTEVAMEDDEDYQKKMNHVIAVFKNERYCSIYFQAYKNEGECCNIFAKFKIKEIDGKKMYYHLESTINDDSINPDGYHSDVTQDKLMRNQLNVMPFRQSLNIEPDNTQFVWGQLKANKFKKGESIEKFRVEGRKPDGIIEYEVHGEIWYFWYFKDLKSDDGGELEYTFSGEDTE